MRKITVTFMLLVMAFVKMNAQVEYHQGFGFGLHMFVPAEDPFGIGGLSGYTATYQARLNIANLGSTSSIGVMANPAGGFSLNSITGGSFLYDLPVYAVGNFGYFANNDSDSGVGVYAGMGYQFWGFGATDFGSGTGNNPAAILGVRFSINDRPIDLSGSYGFRSDATVLVFRLSYMLSSANDRNDMGGKIRKRRR
jgi:hypothetical protein